MKAEIVRIGNSRGIRIPKTVLEQCGFGDTVEMTVEQDRLIISPERTPRQGWAQLFQAAGSGDKDELLAEGSNQFDRDEWEW